MAEVQDVETLKRRGRRRLVGAVALVLLAVIVLPMVFDPEPRTVAPPVSVRIPGESEAPFQPKPAAKTAPKPATKAPVEEYVVQVGAFSDPQAVLEKLAAAKLPYYTEVIKGNLTRVRAGPFPSKAAAEKAQARLKALGLEPGSVSARSG